MSALFCAHNLRKFLEILDDVELVFAKKLSSAKLHRLTAKPSQQTTLGASNRHTEDLHSPGLDRLDLP
jgi:hypothetical protein